mgnify:CR=1 FL=1
MWDGNNQLRCRLRGGSAGVARRHLVKSRSQLEATTTADHVTLSMTTTSDAEPPCVECEEEPRSALDFARTNWRRVGLALLYLALAAFALAQHHASKKNANATQPQDLGALAEDIISK